MAITLGSYTFDEARTEAVQWIEEVGGREQRRVTLSGIVEGDSLADSVAARMLDVAAACSPDSYETPLYLRPERRLMVRRIAYKQTITGNPPLGSFEITLEAADRFEESVYVSQVTAYGAIDGVTRDLENQGAAPAPLTIQITPRDPILNPRVSDGVRTIAYEGTLPAGSVLVLDGESAAAHRDGEEAMPFVTGLFPLVAPAMTTVTFYADDASAADVQYTFRQRWW